MQATLNLLQWPAMAVTLLAAWLVASASQQRRRIGFWCYLGSNALWVTWGVTTGSWALVLLQFGLAAMNLRGMRKNSRSSKQTKD
ncbi:hypothetical protein [Derxia gummosa]|uniref:Amino acid transporter n=1 Tax=Derxia gummosa DSM 723 TaxID=1121388 RepID=A0A8B6X6K0_9BURK|nr:hypothetical protein [Derxia gummosa]